MNLLTEEIISQFEAHPIGSQDGKGLHAEVLVKYFNPCGSGTWLITEAERDLYTGGKYLRDFLPEEEIRQLETLG